MKITAILFDLDGTLVDSRLDIAMAFQQAWRAVIGGIPPNPGMISRHIGKSLAEMLGEFEVLLSPQRLSAFVTTYQRAFVSQDAHLTQPYPGVIECLQALSTLALGIVTTKGAVEAEVVLQRLSLDRFFGYVQTGSSGLRLKPAPDGILVALDILKCAPERTLMV